MKAARCYYLNRCRFQGSSIKPNLAVKSNDKSLTISINPLCSAEALNTSSSSLCDFIILYRSIWRPYLSENFDILLTNTLQVSSDLIYLMKISISRRPRHYLCAKCLFFPRQRCTGSGTNTHVLLYSRMNCSLFMRSHYHNRFSISFLDYFK